MRSTLQMIVAVAALITLLNMIGCQTAPITTTTSPTATSPATSPSPVPSLVAVKQTSTTDLPVTLPVLDALLTDEAFVAELKSKLQLTDDNMNKLRAIAREETSKLRETDEDEYSGTTTDATSHAAGQIKAVIGSDKFEQLATLVRERWSRGGEGEAGALTGASTILSARPNAVPTDTRIVVNAPAYRMDVFENGELIKSYKIGIGYPEFPLPTGLRQAKAIIFNPTWTPPDEPWVEAGSSKVKVGQKVPAGSKLNPLGLIKIPIGSPSLIHGGKSPAKLGSFASHGCVGLTNQQVQDFAFLLAQLGGAELTPKDVAEYAKNKTETKQVTFDSPIPVELRYETIVIEDSKLHIYRDVYDHGTNTEENLRAVLETHGVTLDQLSEQERAQVMDALKQMARDASGNPSDGIPNASPTPSPSSSSNKNANKKSDAENAKVTRTIKGKKEIVIEIAALKGKGYPAPVNFDMGSGSKKNAAAPPKQVSKRQ